MAAILIVAGQAAPAHEWQIEADHFHKDMVEAAFATLEPLATRGELAIRAAAIPAVASDLAFGFALALSNWNGVRRARDIEQDRRLNQATRAMETLSVLIDAGRPQFRSLTLERLAKLREGLTDGSSEKEYFDVSYGYRVKAVSESDREAAAAYSKRFDQLKSQVIQK